MCINLEVVCLIDLFNIIERLKSSLYAYLEKDGIRTFWIDNIVFECVSWKECSSKNGKEAGTPVRLIISYTGPMFFVELSRDLLWSWNGFKCKRTSSRTIQGPSFWYTKFSQPVQITVIPPGHHTIPSLIDTKFWFWKSFVLFQRVWLLKMRMGGRIEAKAGRTIHGAQTITATVQLKDLFHDWNAICRLYRNWQKA